LVVATAILALGMAGVDGSLAGASSSSKPTISDFSATPSVLNDNGGTVTLSANVTNAINCAFSSKPAIAGLPATIPCSDGTVTEDTAVPANTGIGAATYRFSLNAIGISTVRAKTATVKVAPFIGGVVSISGDDSSYCVVLDTGAVNCWGEGTNGDLGDGKFYKRGDPAKDGSPVPVPVEGAAGIGSLTGVVSLTGSGSGDGGYCAVLTSGEVDCWGIGAYGDLGDGLSSNSAFPVSVEGIGGTGTLTGVASLTAAGNSYCAVLTSKEVDCWGSGNGGALGNGSFDNSAFPVSVEGMAGTGTLTDVAGLADNGSSYCAVLTSGGVDCWGQGEYGALGNGEFYETGNGASAFPVSVEAVGGTGTLTGVASLAGSGNGYCATLSAGGVDCWGQGEYGALGNGSFDNSAVPVSVEGVGGTGTLTGVDSLTGSADIGFCAVLTSGGVDCWGSDFDGDLGNGEFYTSAPYASAVPVSVEGVGGAGTLTGVSSVSTDGNAGSWCALLTSGAVDCWGEGGEGNLGNGEFYTSRPYGSAFPVSVEGVHAKGTLIGVAHLASDLYPSSCALLTSGGVDCWGFGYGGALGDGRFYAYRPSRGSAVPANVLGAR
jgi:alpha-tubulin suppressor-like RCC1 family protein